MTRPDERRIMEISLRESPASQPSFGVEVLIPTGIFTLAAYVIVRVARPDNQPLAEQAAAIVCFLALAALLVVWHSEGRPVHFTERTRYLDDDAPEPIRPFVGSDERGQLIIGRFDFNRSEWARIGRVLATGKVTRAKLEGLQRDNGDPLWTSLTERYPTIVAELQRVGFINDQNETTPFAYEWFGDNGIDLPRDVD